MLPLLALIVPGALAGDRALYERTMQLVEQHYLHAEALSREAMLAGAANQLEARIEWLLVEGGGGGVSLKDGSGKWEATVRLEEDGLGAALARLEDAVRGAGLPLDEDLDLRVEILRGAARSLDRHSVVLYADGLERFDERLSGTLSGVGATISLGARGLYVRELVSGGPAARGGLHEDDALTTIDGVSTVGMVPSDATDRIRGAAGTSVTLGVLRGEAALTFTLRREELTIRNVEASRGPHGVGVIRIAHFSEQTRTYLLEALAELTEGDGLAKGLVIDLRGNTGGSLLQSAQAADAFLQSGLIVRTVNHDGSPVPGLVPRLDAHPESPGHTMPIAVLMDHATASGSEILAGALGNLDRAILVGGTSFGKGTVQKIYQIDPTIKLKLTVAEYLLEGGTRVADVGLAPDIALEEVRFEDRGPWYPSPARERRRLRPGTPVLQHAGDEDRALEVAAAILAASEGNTRGELLAAMRRLEPALLAEDDARLSEAFRGRGLDWTAAPAALDGEPALDVSWRLSSPPRSGQSTEISATVTNRGPGLHRAALRLDSVDPLWDDLVLPIGKLDRGASYTTSLTVAVGPGLPTRTDRVGVSLEADGITARPLLTHDVTITGDPPPAVAITARALPTGTAEELRLVLDVENRTDRFVTGAQARVAFPKVEGIELIHAESDAVSINAHGTARLELRLRVRPAWQGDTLPLELTVSGAGQRLVDWDLAVPRGGAPLRLEAPTLVIDSPPPLLPTGTARLRVRATDDRALDHIVVYAGPETVNRLRTTPVVEHDRDKVAWRAATGRREELEVLVPIVPGTNRYVIVAEDRTGLRTQRDVYIFGDDGGAGVTALPE